MVAALSRRGLLIGSGAVPLARQVRPLNAPGAPAGFGVTGGSRILPAATALGPGLSGVSVTGGSTVTLYNGPVSGASYVINLDTLNGASGSPLPFTKLSMLWKTGPGGLIIAGDHWFMLQTNVSPAANNTLVTGRGPTKGPWLTALLKNEDNRTVTIDGTLWQSSRQAPRDDLRSFSNNISGQYTGTWLTGSAGAASTPTSDPPALILGCSDVLTVPHSGALSRINALYAGQAQLTVFSAGGTDISVELDAADPDFVPPQAVLQPLFIGTLPASGHLVAENITIPRMPTVITISNANAVTDFGATYALVAQEFAS